jgi:uncharacterized membrane protein
MAGVAYAGLSHWMTLFHPTAPWAVVVLLGPLWLAAMGFAASWFGRWGFVAAAALGVGGFALVFLGEAGDPNRLYVLQHVAINSALCGWFGSTLRGKGLPLITQFAQRVHPLKGHMLSYTTQLTRIWTAFFALVVAASVAALFHPAVFRLVAVRERAVPRDGGAAVRGRAPGALPAASRIRTHAAGRCRARVLRHIVGGLQRRRPMTQALPA